MFYTINDFDCSKIFTVTEVLFKTLLMDTSERIELYSVADFLAICGSLLGLFVGASVLSIIELIYFATLHLFWKVRLGRLNNAIAPSNDEVESSSSPNDQNMHIEDNDNVEHILDETLNIEDIENILFGEDIL